MNDLKVFFDGTKSIMQTSMTIYGFTFSWWDVFLWAVVAGLLIWFLRRIFDD
jgi:hypothetical protein